ncbi:Phosphatidylinositol 3-kinase, root isoform [Erysiphe neolycopersici]|uniref:Phosphatidylinositol 3-kinase VPS34 n=1 Tax=Erysiphe neolycopersici TaxID=212602 RepID=A0A420HDI1_9PEZI|nr:Phosphatidylinositol 3-kinase, root isoform [Erysiphe neolycopersici]
MDPFSFASSDAINIPVHIKIVSLDGEQTQIPFSTLLQRPDLRHIGSNLSSFSDLFVTVQPWADSKPLTVPVQTAYKPFKNERRWNEWLSLPINYSCLPLSTQLAITVWDLSPCGGEGARGHAVPFGGTTLPMFDNENQLQKGRQKCHLHRRKMADGLSGTKTPSTLPQSMRSKMISDGRTLHESLEEMDRLEKLLKKHELGEIPRVEWLDQLVFRGIEKHAQEASRSSVRAYQRSFFQSSSTMPGSSSRVDDNSGIKELDGAYPEYESFTLYVELPRFDFPIVFADHEYPMPPISSLQQLSSSQSNIMSKPLPEVHYGPGINGSSFASRFKIYDPEVGARDNPAESKHRRLVRSHRTGVVDRDLKPNAKVRDELNSIIAYAPTQILLPDEKDLIWKFRHHLTSNKRALTKFVKSVNWQDQSESRQAVQILSSSKWTEVDVDDALELLGPTFDNSAVRAYAVDRLRKSDDNELLLYLLQLVQALKFEPVSESINCERIKQSSLTKFLIERATNSFMLGNYFHWYLMVECDDQSNGQGDGYRKLFAKVEYEYMTELVKKNGGVETRKLLLRQAELIAVLSKISMDIKISKESVARKTENVKQLLSDPKNGVITIDPPLPLPLDPSVMLVGVDPAETHVFKSSLFPIMLTFKTVTKQKYQIIFKTGDDLRQDQLVIQIISLMDQLLQKENLDLKLSPYKILATGASAGAVQFVPSVSLQSVVKKFKGNPVLAYLEYNNPDDTAPLGVRKEALEIFTRSCAGYCVITYLLGVGDRHLDNLLLAPDGHFFHADFGFILGRDPKPFAPAMKLCKEMVDGMGGANSAYYAQFKQYCFTAYTTLRKSSNLILNLFSLMVDANIPDIRIEPDKAVLKVKERFHMEMSEEDAIRHFDTLIEDSSSAIFPVVIDRLHGLVQHFRT